MTIVMMATLLHMLLFARLAWWRHCIDLDYRRARYEVRVHREHAAMRWLLQRGRED